MASLSESLEYNSNNANVAIRVTDRGSNSNTIHCFFFFLQNMCVLDMTKKILGWYYGHMC